MVTSDGIKTTIKKVENTKKTKTPKNTKNTQKK